VNLHFAEPGSSVNVFYRLIDRKTTNLRFFDSKIETFVKV